jgi:peptidoglycan/LPS O-acetylase OafA/YrhL
VIGFAFADNGSIGMSFTDFLKRLVIWLSGGLRDGPTPLVQPMEWWHFVAGNWWTLRHEWLLYALVPAFAGLINKSRSRLMYFGTTVVMLAAFKGIPSVLLHAANLSFIGGAILAMIVNRPAKKWLLILSIFTSVFSLANIFDFPGYVPYAIPATTITYLVLRDNKLQRLLSTKAIRMVGESSYSIYMLHGIVILLTTKLIRSTTCIPYSITCLVQFLVLLAVSRLVYLLIELPGVRIGKYLTTRLFGMDKSATTTVTN